MSELIKYLSPVALLGLIWAIIQFYQKRRYERRDLYRKEKLAVYSMISSILRDIEFEIFQFMSSSRIPLIKIGSRAESISELINKIEHQNEKTDSDINILANKNLIDDETLNNLKSKLNTNKKLIEEISIHKMNVKKENIEEITPLFQKFISQLELKKDEINRISTITLSEKEILKKEIFRLTVEISVTIEIFYTKKHMDEKGIPNKEFIKSFHKIYDTTESLKNLIDNHFPR